MAVAHRLRIGTPVKPAHGPQELESYLAKQLVRESDVKILHDLLEEYTQLRYASAVVDDKAAQRWLARVKRFRPAKRQGFKAKQR